MSQSLKIDRVPFYGALMLALFSGCAALGHQLLWTRRMIDLLGASSESITCVLGCFFFGLAVGAWLASRILRRGCSRPWRAVARAELAVAALAVPAIFLPSWTDWLWPAIGAERLTSGVGGTIKLVLSVLVVLSPAVAMGLVLPFMVTALSGTDAIASRRRLWLYAINTLGGAAGVVLVAGVLLHAVGAFRSMLLVAGLNLAIAIGAWYLDRTRSPRASASPVADPVGAKPGDEEMRHRNRLLLMLALCSGGAILAMEVLAVEMIMLVAPLSYHAPAVILFTVILVLGLAAPVAPRLLRWCPDRSLTLALVLAASAVIVSLTPAMFMAVAIKTGGVQPATSLLLFLLKLGALVLFTLGPAVFVTGLVFPIVLAAADRDSGGIAGRRWGLLLAVNGLGGLIGAEAAYHIILPAFGVHAGIGMIALGYGVVATFVAIHRGIVAHTWRLPVTCVTCTLAVGIFCGLYLQHLPHLNPHLKVRTIAELRGRDGILAVIEGKKIGRAIIASNQYILGSTSVRYDQERQAHIPLLLHPNPQQVGFIGLATGITPGAALQHGAVEQITAVELSSLVVKAADEHFGKFNHEVTRKPRVRVVIEDGRTFMAAQPAGYDVIVGDLFLPWGPGEGRLYSIEHFRSVRSALRPGGVFCQWLAMYQLTPEQFDVIAATFHRVFPRTFLFRNRLQPDMPSLALVGFMDDDLDWSIVTERCRQERRHGQVLDPIVRHAEGLGILYLGPWADTGLQEVNTLDNLWIELDAVRERITGNPGTKYLTGPPWVSYLNQVLGRQGIGDNMHEQMHLGLALTEWELAARARHTAAGALARRIAASVPNSLRADIEADWERWPGARPLQQFITTDDSLISDRPRRSSRGVSFQR